MRHRGAVPGERRAPAGRGGEPPDLLNRTIVCSYVARLEVNRQMAREYPDRLGAMEGITGVGEKKRAEFGEIFARIEAHFHTPALRAKTLADHEAIVAALETHDPEAARQAMHRHLQRVAREFQRRWEESGGGKSGDSRGSKARAPDKLTGEGAGGRVATRRAGDDGTTTSTDPHRNADRTR